MKVRKEKVVILAGGRGTRLRPFTATFPKPLVPVGDMPILEILLRQLARQGFADVALTLGHLADLIRAYFAQHRSLTKDLNIRFFDEETPTGTAGSLASVPGLDATFLVMNGDLLTNLDFGSLLDYHRRTGAVLTIASHRQQVKIDLGVLETDESGRLVGYIEKPESRYEVSMGIYVYEPEVLQYIRKGEYLDFPTLVLKLLADGKNVQAYRNDAFWLDIGRPDDYAKAQEIFSSDRAMFGI